MGLFKKANWPQVYQQLPKTVIERGHKYLSLTSPLSKSCQTHPGTVQGFKFRFKSTWADTFVMLLSLALLSWAAALNTPGGKLTQQKRGKKPQYWDHTRKSAEERQGWGAGTQQYPGKAAQISAFIRELPPSSALLALPGAQSPVPLPFWCGSHLLFHAKSI